MSPLLKTQRVNIITQQGKNTKSPLNRFQIKHKMLMGMPMGYGIIASNGAAHGSKAQTIV